MRSFERMVSIGRSAVNSGAVHGYVTGGSCRLRE